MKLMEIRRSNYLKAIKSLKNRFQCEMPDNLRHIIDLELE